MSFIQEMTKANPRSVDTLDGFAYLRYLPLGTTKADIVVTTKSGEIYVHVTNHGETTRHYVYLLFGREKFKKVSFIEDIGLLILYVTCHPTQNEEPVRHPIL